MNTFICYDRCGTCKKAKKWMDENGISYTIRPIKEENPTAEELEKWIPESGKEPKKFFNTSGILYREMELSKKLPSMPEDQQFALLASDGMMVKRPLLITDEAVIPGFKEDLWQAALKLN